MMSSGDYSRMILELPIHIMLGYFSQKYIFSIFLIFCEKTNLFQLRHRNKFEGSDEICPYVPTSVGFETFSRNIHFYSNISFSLRSPTDY